MTVYHVCLCARCMNDCISCVCLYARCMNDCVLCVFVC